MSSAALSPAATTSVAPAGMSEKKMGVWAALTSFFLMWTFLYVVLVVFRPSWVCVVRAGPDALLPKDVSAKEALELDQARAFVVALVITLIVMLIVWLVMATASK